MPTTALPPATTATPRLPEGIDLDRATLALWMGRLAWWLKPLHEVLLDTILSYPKLFADETPPFSK